MSRQQPQLPIILPAIARVFMALIFILSAISKISDPIGTMDYISSAGLPFAELGLGIAILLELGGGLCLISGFFARPVAFILAMFCFVTGLLFHLDFADQNQFIHFLKNIAMTGGLLQITAFGPGSFSIDEKRATINKQKKGQR